MKLRDIGIHISADLYEKLVKHTGHGIKHHKHGHDRDDHHDEDRHCPPGQAKKGHC